ncbi:MAG: type II toxin-antitoxin system VapC family toxin [bacterium]|nr:type II toxin-antitoxin system VapC family toxin [bacterium]
MNRSFIYETFFHFMKHYFVETSAIINYLRGKQRIVDAINNLDGEITSSYICLAELYEGISRVRERDRAEHAVLQFFSGLSQVYGLDETIAKAFGELRAQLKQTGKVVEDIDLFIAATCLAANLTLITENQKHFQRIENLAIFPLKEKSSPGQTLLLHIRRSKREQKRTESFQHQK